MALFSRVGFNPYMILNTCRCKLLYNFMEINTPLKRFKHKVNSVTRNKPNVYPKEVQEHQDSPSSFGELMESRRNEAKRSILVEVLGYSTYADLHNYCINYGQVISMHYFCTANKKHMILVEFDNMSTVNVIKENAQLFNCEFIIPTKLPVLWFQQVANGSTKRIINVDKKIISQYTRTVTEADLKDKLIDSYSISQQILVLYNESKLDELSIRLRHFAALLLEEIFRGFFPNIVIHPFGSSVNGFGKKACDLDLVMNLNNDEKKKDCRLVFQSKVFSTDEIEHVRKLLSIMSDSIHLLLPGITNMKKILKARVPIVKFQHSFMDLECDLSINNMFGVYMSELLYLYGEIDFRVRPLVFTIRKWAKYEAVTSSSPGPWITNFSLTLLVLFYLQNVGVLPSLISMKTHIVKSDERRIRDIGDCSFPRDIRHLKDIYNKSKNNSSTADLLLDFFLFYGKFDFDQSGVCIRQGTSIKKSVSRPLYIVNPLQPILNVSHNVSLEEVLRFKALSQMSFDVLNKSKTRLKSSWGITNLIYPEDFTASSKQNTFKVQGILNNVDKTWTESSKPSAHEDVKTVRNECFVEGDVIKKR